MRLHYSQSTQSDDGAEFRNPRFFSAPEAGVEAVTIHGEWPAIVEAYVAAGVPVQLVGAAAPVVPVAPVVAEPVAIPDGWRDLPWNAMRALANALGATVINKASASKVVEAELIRRAMAQAPMSEPVVLVGRSLSEGDSEPML